ncbi:major facilitator superfamily domain-containing protein [Cladorrhinum sp. PSN259]|nr:major facilitator superfamily domain-containing protein [Cladorrhinum sp. PSN259]
MDAGVKAPDTRGTTDVEIDTEHTPLLPGSLPESSTGQTEEVTSDRDNDPGNVLRAQLRPTVILLAFIILFLIELAIGMVAAPTNAIMESIICRQMHPDELLLPSHSGTVVGGIIRHFAGGVFLVDNPICKSPDVQGKLAMIRAWGYTFDCLPGILLSVPYGMVSDKWGRKPVIYLSLLGVILGQIFTDLVYYFSDFVPLWTVWFSSAFQIIGGGSTILTAMLYTVLADVVPVSERATVFLQLTACFLTSQMIAGPLGGLMMIGDPWYPLMGSLACFAVAYLVLWAFPETLHVHDHKADSHEESSLPDVSKLWDKVHVGLGDVSCFILGNKSFVFLMMSVAFIMLGRFVGEVLLQYATERYGWSWSDASFILAIRSVVSLVTLLVLTPLASWFCLHRLGMTGMGKDLWLARWSVMIAIVGCLIIASAANGSLFCIGLVWFALGSGLTPLIRSLLNSLVEEQHIGIMNTLVGLMETAGLTMAGPLLAKSLSVGLELGGPWVGLPFVTAGSFFTISCTILWIFRLPSPRNSSAEPVC